MDTAAPAAHISSTNAAATQAAAAADAPPAKPAAGKLVPTPPPAQTGKVNKAPQRVVGNRKAGNAAEAVKDLLRKNFEQTFEISESEDEEEIDDGKVVGEWAKPVEITAAICEALKKNFVFRGIPDGALTSVVDRMFGICFPAGAVVLQQGERPKPDDCMYFLQSGEVEVVITTTGGADRPGLHKDDAETQKIEGHIVRIPQKPGWLFGDVALLFSSQRTASIVAKTDIIVWALDSETFLRFVMRYAQGARALRFVRQVPLLKGLNDNDLIRVAGKMPERVYEDDQPLIRYGERGDEMYLIRYGKVRVLVPGKDGSRIQVAILGRGQFVGERSVINDKLRSADCVAQGRVQVIVMKKRDFMEFDNPLLSLMLDYDSVASVLRRLPVFQRLQLEQMEQVIDRLDARQELMKGDVVLQQGAVMDRLYVIKNGEVSLLKDDQPVPIDPTFIKESGGFNFFGDSALEALDKSAYTVVVRSEALQLLCLPRKQLDGFLGTVGAGLARSSIVATLKNSSLVQALPEEDLHNIVAAGEPVRYSAGDVIAAAGTPAARSMWLVRSGEVALVSPTVNLQGHEGKVDVAALGQAVVDQLQPGDIYNEEVLANVESAADVSLVAVVNGTVVVRFGVSSSAQLANGASATSASKPPVSTLPSIPFTDLEFHRIVGTGQFGLVRVTRNIKSNEVYALKVMHKAPITESKQIEHVINERRILEEARHPFCVRLMAAYQDKASLYLLQEWVAGGELFHHLDIEGAFDEATAMFYAANVLLALEFLHDKGIVYRDLKPENLLIDTQGYIKMADFGFAKKIGTEKTYTICGTPDYQAPEVIMRRGTTKAADYWALGVLIFEMLVGDPPFKSLTGDPWDTFRRTLSGRFYVPQFISDQAADLIFKLLQVNPDKRLGSGRNGADEIKRHKWFSRLDWAALEAKKLPAPIRPRVRNPLDTSNFDNFDNVDEKAPPVPPSRQDKHQNWELWEWIPERAAAGQ